MDQSEIDALMKNAPAAKAKPAVAAPPAQPQPVTDDKGHVISELDAVTAVTERETNKVMDQLDVISGLVGKQQNLVTGLLAHPAAQDPAVQKAINEVMASGKDIQDKVYEAMDLMQFQDITRQKLERIVHHLRQIHDYIVDLLGTGLKSEGERASISRTIATTGTTPDERKEHADSVVEEFRRLQSKD
ncbi:hypothetical protein [Mesoterricola sediminis]|uniref:Chemotaxis protein CheZ n=1 Tax=Mesoterricola sediminis TaxID=2927980 RepID=A0AA48KE51_9BACT|nr:hypothetical protein [Mesoterricola sediminis]BDU75128.1 hypothetical protein METESE_00860 [Mesoterricola sediminis]